MLLPQSSSWNITTIPVLVYDICHDNRVLLVPIVRVLDGYQGHPIDNFNFPEKDTCIIPNLSADS